MHAFMIAMYHFKWTHHDIKRMVGLAEFSLRSPFGREIARSRRSACIIFNSMPSFQIVTNQHTDPPV